MPNAQGQKYLSDIETEVADELWGLPTASLVRPTQAVLDRIINDCEREICGAYNWSWMYYEGNFNTVINQQTPYTMPVNVQDILWMTVPAYQAKIGWMSMAEWQAGWPGRWTAAGPTRPWAYIEAPYTTDGNNTEQWFLFPQADKVYSVNFGARLMAGVLTNPSDVPVIPQEWQGMLLNKIKATGLRYVGGSSMDRVEGYEEAFQEGWKLAWLADQSKAETVNKFRSAEAERALSITGNSASFLNNVWMRGI